MNSCWVLLPEDGVLTVRNGHAAAITVVVRPGLHPAVVQDGVHTYPVEWKGFIWHGGVSEHWQFASGPVKEVRLRTDNNGDRWVLIVWK